MPHKHKRKRGDDDALFNLPPSQKARPLPVASKGGAKLQKTPSKGNAKLEENPPKAKRRGKGWSKDDDAPRAFRRIMAVAQGKRIRSGLDNGDDKTTTTKAEAAERPRIQPGEDLRSFSVRVNAALPISGLTKKTVIKDGKDEAGLKVFRTRKEKKMHKLYEQWRAEDRKIKEKREEELELAAERELDDNDNDTPGLTTALAEFHSVPGKKKGRKRRDEDPWEELKRKRRAEEKARGEA